MYMYKYIWVVVLDRVASRHPSHVEHAQPRRDLVGRKAWNGREGEGSICVHIHVSILHAYISQWCLSNHTLIFCMQLFYDPMNPRRYISNTYYISKCPLVC